MNYKQLICIVIGSILGAISAPFLKWIVGYITATIVFLLSDEV